MTLQDLPRTRSPVLDEAGQSTLASSNERMLLDIVRRHEPIARAAIAPMTNLTQQSVHRLMEGLLERGLLRAGAPLRGGRGQPSPTIELVREAVYSVGISINTDSAVLCLADFGCGIVEETRLTNAPQERERTLALLRDTLDALLARHRIPRERLLGLGFGMSGFFVSPETRAFNAPEPLRDWSLIDLRPILVDTFGLPVWVENNATTGAIGESLRGAGLWSRTFAYLSFNYGFGGGVVIDGKPYFGYFGNAGEFSGIYDAEESLRRPALRYLLDVLHANGIDIRTVDELRQNFDPRWPGVEGWIDRTMPTLDRLINTLVAVLDPQAIVFGGQLPPELGRMMIARAHLRTTQQHRYGVAPPQPKLVLSEAEGDAAVIGAALLPLKTCFFM